MSELDETADERQIRELQEAEAADNLSLTGEPSYWDLATALNIMADQWGGYFDGRVFVDATARSEKLSFCAAFEKNFRQVRGIVDDAYVYRQCQLSVVHHRHNRTYGDALPPERSEQEVDFIPGDFSRSTGACKWEDAYVVMFNTVNQPEVLAALQSKPLRDRLREMEERSFMLWATNSMQKPLPGWALRHRWHNEKDLGGYIQLYQKTEEKGAFSEEEMLEMLMD
jgi:hypothetical protein